VVPVLLKSIAEALVRMDTCKQNECHAPFLGNYSNQLMRASATLCLGGSTITTCNVEACYLITNVLY